jgi:hypothetical protein
MPHPVFCGLLRLQARMNEMLEECQRPLRWPQLGELASSIERPNRSGLTRDHEEARVIDPGRHRRYERQLLT